MTPTERAAKMIKQNRYLTLGTADDVGPWVAPINYVIGPGAHLHFYSASNARHSVALARKSLCSGAIFDSRAASEDVDGLQFEATCDVVEDPDLEPVHSHYFEVNFADPAVRKWWYRPPGAFGAEGIWRFYRITLSALYVIDFESITKERVDRRVDVALDDMWEIIGRPSE